MFTRLQVRNFRALDDLTVERMSRINLVTGRNNSGKTTLLEAVFLLCGAGQPRMALNPNAVRGIESAPDPANSETFWKPIFASLDMSRPVEVAGSYSSLGPMRLNIGLEQPATVELPFEGSASTLTSDPANASGLLFSFRLGPKPKVEGRIRMAADGFKIDPPDAQLPFQAVILLPRTGHPQEDAMRLGQLRKRKQAKLVADALRIVEPRLKSVEDNTALGAPMIWGDIGLSELIPLPVMGEGMTRIARMILAISAAPNGVVLIDEIENGLHHSVLGKVWQSIEAAAKQFNTQVIASTHSFECVEAAYRSLDKSNFLVHRLEEADGRVGCVSYEPDEIEAAVSHSLEVR